MKVLPAGPKKYLLFDLTAIERNSSRKLSAAPIVAVVIPEPGEDQGPVTHYGMTLHVTGTVAVEYSQHGNLLPRNGVIRAAYITTDEVVLDLAADESTAPAPTTAVNRRPARPQPIRSANLTNPKD